MPPRDAMNCPLCGKPLTAAEHRDAKGRFHCPACSTAGAAESQKGWVPRPVILEKRTAHALDNRGQFANPSDPTFGRNGDGTVITRTARCECGILFEQQQLSERWIEAVERVSPRAVRMMQQQIPDFFVPVHCPKCERVDLGRRFQLDLVRENEPELSLAAD